MNVTIKDSLRLSLCLLLAGILCLTINSQVAHGQQVGYDQGEASEEPAATEALIEVTSEPVVTGETEEQTAEQSDSDSATEEQAAVTEEPVMASGNLIDATICDQATDELATICANDGGEYVYVAQPGDNLTLLVRRSIQLHMANTGQTLPTAQVIAAETYAVQTMGAFELDINQRVEVSADLVARCSAQASILDQAAINRWAVYQPIDETIDEIVPVSQPASAGVQTPVEPVADHDTGSDVTETTDKDKDVDKDKDKDEGISWYWWVLGIVLILVIVWRLISLKSSGNRRGPGASANIVSGSMPQPGGTINPTGGIQPVKRKRGRPRKNT